MTSPGLYSGDVSRRQKRMGPAPFASFEDLSDELESPDEKIVQGSVVRLPGIREDATPTTPAILEKSPSPSFPITGISLIGVINKCSSETSPVMSSLTLNIKPNLKTATTPRIDISRASSSSHHDSRDSSPEREIFDSRDPNSAKLGLGFKEDGALDLRSSTEELDFQDIQETKRSKNKPQSPTAPDDMSNVRKDSQCSDIILLSISGRTSRLSSIGSQGSGQSRLSNASHLSVISGQSGISRCSSPHKMVLETSFCGTKPPEGAKLDEIQPGTKVETEELEKVLLSRKHDPTEAIIAEGISVEIDPKILKVPPEKPLRKSEPRVGNVKSDIKIKVDKPVSESNNKEKIPKKIISESGVEYIYIPLKGPLPIDNEAPVISSAKQKLREVKSASFQSRPTMNSKSSETKQKSKSTTPSPINQKKMEEPKYIRIKLKPDTFYDDKESTIQRLQKPDSLELDDIKNIEKPNTCLENNHPPRLQKTQFSTTPNGSPKIPRDSGLPESNIESVTPSPSVSRRSSFTSLFKSKEAVMSPESPSFPGYKRKNTLTGILREAGDNLRTRSRSRSKSRDRDSHKSSLSTAPSSTESIDSKSKHKSVLSLFKSNNRKDKIKSESENSSQETLPSIEGIGKVEFKFNEPTKPSKTHYENPLEAASIRIPLHSPTYYEDRSVSQDWKTSSQDSQETVIEASTCKNVNVIVESIPCQQEPVKCINNIVNKVNSRQSSTSSENMVFSTKLGNDNEIFTTKLPKKIPKEPVVNIVVENGTDSENTCEENIRISHLQKKSEPDLNIAYTEEKMVAVDISNKIPIKTINTEDIDSMENEHLENEQQISQVSTGILSNINSILGSNIEDDRNSSESERDSEVFHRNKKDRDLKLDLDLTEPERKAIVFQQDSFEDELPYIPTTLPLERSAAVPIVPIKQRSAFDVKTYPIERPRSTTPINPSCLEDYCEEVMGSFNIENVTKTLEKLKISLPRNESFEKTCKEKSPRKKESNTNWQEFAEKGISIATRSTPPQINDTPPPLPPKGLQKAWINFDDIPEKRKAPKRIQTIPSRSYIEVPESVLQDNVVYNYVNPDECKCECHELNAKERERRNKDVHMPVQEDELPLLEDDVPDDDKTGLDCSEKIQLDVTISDCRSIISDSSVDLSTSVDPQEISGADTSLKTPFTSDLGISSNRSSIVSQDERQSPESPNACPKIC